MTRRRVLFDLEKLRRERARAAFEGPIVEDDDLRRRLSPEETSKLCGLLKGRVSWRGEYALAAELGIDVSTLRRAIRRRRLAPKTIERLRVALAARELEGGGVAVALTGKGASA